MTSTLIALVLLHAAALYAACRQSRHDRIRNRLASWRWPSKGQ